MGAEDNCCKFDCILDFLKEYEGTIKKSLYQTSLIEREDLEQELYIKLIEKTQNLNFREEAPAFWDLIEENFGT